MRSANRPTRRPVPDPTWVLAAVGTVLLLTVAAVSGTVGSGPRPAHWAERLDRTDGLPNLFRVDDGLLRGAQPQESGFEALRALGVQTLINLRPGRSEGKAVHDAGLGYEEIPMRAYRVREADLVRFLRLATDEQRRPVFLHCRRGADRTGLLVAVYRVAVQGWSREEAVREMVEGGFGFNPFWSNLIRYVERLDVEAIRSAAGLDEPAPVGGTEGR